MTDRISKPLAPMQEYGRKPYLVTEETVPLGEEADYRYMMDKTWHKAQDNKYIVVQSVKKKPYNEQDYQMMENGGDYPIFTFPQWNFKMDVPFNTTCPIVQKIETQTIGTGLRWIKCPISVSASDTYTVIVQNSSITTSTLVSGRTNSKQKTYLPTLFNLTNATSDARGLSISNVINEGSTTRTTLTTSSSARGSYYIYAYNNDTSIRAKISVSSLGTIIFTRVVFSPLPTLLYHKLDNIILGLDIPYTVLTTTSDPFLEPMGGSYYDFTTTDYPDSFVTHYSYARTLVLYDDTVLLSAVYQQYNYENYLSAQSRTVGSGIMFGTGGAGVPLAKRNEYVYVYSADYKSAYDTNYTYYYKFAGNPVSAISTDLVIFESAQSGTATYEYSGTDIVEYHFIDNLSNVVIGAFYGDGATGNISGKFSGSNFAASITWFPIAVTFGTV